MNDYWWGNRHNFQISQARGRDGTILAMKASPLTLIKALPRRKPKVEAHSAPVRANQSNSSSRSSRSKQGIWWGLGAILLFAASYLQLGLVQWSHAPASDRVNNGNEPTFFAVNICPHGITSEDFHLYWVRSQRILKRGWKDSLFHQRSERDGANYVAPFQVLLGMVALATHGRPIPYSIFMACVFAAGWGTLFLVARRNLPAKYSTASIVLAVMVAVLFESLAHFFMVPTLGEDFPWPLHRHMRLSTLAWTTPLLLASMVAASSFWFEIRQPWRKLATVASILLVLSCSDNWAFMLGLLAAGIVWAGLAVAWCWRRLAKTPSGLHAAFLSAFGAALALMFGLNQYFLGPLSGDVELRAGAGPNWIEPRRDPGVFADLISNWLLPWGAICLGVIAVLSIWLAFQIRKLGSFTWLVRFRATAFDHWRPLTIAGISIVTMIGLLAATAFKGLMPFVRNQCYWRVDVVLLFSLVLILADVLRSGMWIVAKRFPSWSRASRPIVLALLACLFVYHQYRIHWFREHVVGQEYFLTRDTENLRSWLKHYCRTHDRFELATLSPELNFLAAYWTNADLMLPSGFPYHSLNTNLEIRRNAVDLLRLYRATPETWQSFVERKHLHFFTHWRESRAEAAGLSFLYYLFHLTASLDSSAQPDWRARETKAIAHRLESASNRKVHEPEVIIIDEVSRALGNPDLSNYTRKFFSSTIEAWVRNKRSSIRAAAKDLQRR